MTKTMYEHLGGIVPKANGSYATEVEVELTDGLPEDSYGDFRITRDGSLRGNGYEFISRRPTTHTKLLRDYNSLLDTQALRTLYRKSNRTGVHVHLNVQSWSKDRLLRFLVAYYLVEPLMIRYCGPSRQGNLFCLAMYDAQSVSRAIRLIVDDRYKDLQYNFNDYKYAALNVASVANLGSLEFRALPFTNSKNMFAKWLGFIRKLELYSSKEQSLDSIVDSFRPDPKVFVEGIFGSNSVLSKYEDFYDLVDMNYSGAWNILSIVENKRFRKKKKNIVYSFPTSERDVDTGADYFNY